MINSYRYAGVTYPVDLYSPAAFYSIRLGAEAYSDALVRIRKSADNAEKDFYPDANGRLSLSSEDGAATSLSSWITTESGFIVKWYDQVGTNDITQATAGSQPRIVNAGTLDVAPANGLATIWGLAASVMDFTAGIAAQTILMAAQAGTEDVVNYALSGDLSASDKGGVFLRGSSASVTGAGYFEVDDGVITLVGEDVDIHLVYFNQNGTSKFLARDGSSTTEFTSQSDLVTLEQAFGRTAGPLYQQGHTQEIMLFTGDASANKAAMETESNNYFTIY